MKLATWGLLLALATQLCVAQEKPGTHNIKRKAFGCQEQDEFEQIVRLSVDGDKDAFRKALLTKLLSGRCMILDAGQRVYLNDVKIFSGLVQVRPQGETESFWTNSEAVN